MFRHSCWTHLQIKALRHGELEYEAVHKALLRVFGGDHKPNHKDLGGKHIKDDLFFEEDVDEEFYEDGEDEEWWWSEEAFYEGDEEPEEYEIPEDLENAMDQVDDACATYLESRERMKELALSRGFYPIVALGPDFGGGQHKGGGKGNGKSKGKGNNKGSKGKGKGKGKGCGKRSNLMPRRPMQGLRRPPNSTLSNSNVNLI